MRESASPIERMIDVACKCLKCGKSGSVGSCGCWVRLECSGCQKRKLAERHDTDPHGTATVRVLCPECNRGDFDQPTYFDADGREVFWSD